MSKLFTTGWYDRVETLLALALARAASAADTSGSVQEVRFPIGTAAAQASTKVIPAGAIVIDAELEVEVAYSPGTMISGGNSVMPDLLMATTDNVATSPALYAAHQDTSWPVASTVRLTVAGAPVAGSGWFIVRYVQTPQP